MRFSTLCFLQFLGLADACFQPWRLTDWAKQSDGRTVLWCLWPRQWWKPPCWEQGPCWPPSQPSVTSTPWQVNPTTTGQPAPPTNPPSPHSGTSEQMATFVDQWIGQTQQGLRDLELARQYATTKHWPRAQQSVMKAKDQFNRASKTMQAAKNLAAKLPDPGSAAVLHIIASAEQKLKGHQVCATNMSQQVASHQYVTVCMSQTYQAWQMFPDGLVLPQYPSSPLAILLPGLLITGLAGAFLRSMCGSTHSAMETCAQEGEHSNDAALLCME